MPAAWIIFVIASQVWGPAHGNSDFSVIGVEGAAVELPCTVDVGSCGEVYFITWTKNVSNEWKRIYLYSDAVDKPLQELANPDRADFVLRESSAFLRIQPLMPQDEGTYMCDVTYLKGKCPSLSFATLLIHASPGTPRISFKGEEVSSDATVGPFLEGNRMELQCEVAGGRPRPEVGWWLDEEQLPARVSQSDNDVVTAVLDRKLSRGDLGRKLECRASNAALPPDPGYLAAGVAIDLQVKPRSLEIEGPTDPEIIAARPVYFTCVVEGARPAADITWFNGSTAFPRSATRTRSEDMQDGSVKTTSELEVVLSYRDHGATFYCKGTNPVLQKLGEEPLLKSINLHVLYPPNVIAGPEDGVIVEEGGEARLSCRYEANPSNLTAVAWFRAGQQLDVVKEDVLMPPDVEFPELVLRNISRYDRGLYSCSASNPFGVGNATNVVEISVLFSPMVEAHIFSRRVEEGAESQVTLTCGILEGNPQNLLAVRWFRDFEDGEAELMYEMTEPEITWVGIHRNHTGNYSCQGQNAAGWGERSAASDLVVDYLPGLAQVISLDSQVVRGELTTLVCDATDPGLPPANAFRWETNGETVPETSHKLLVGPADLYTEGNYSCSAVNSVGTGPEGTLFITVYAPPRFVDDLPARTGVTRSGRESSLFCTVECEPECTVGWLRNGEPLPENGGYVVESSLRPRDLVSGRFASVTSTLRWNVSAGFERGRDDANYTCVSSDNDVGEGIESTTQLTVEFAPEKVQLSITRLALREGDTGPTVTCLALSWPPSTYLWILGDRVVADQAELKFDRPANRDRAGHYMCQASNVHGKVSAYLSVDVRYPPTCEIDEVKENGRTHLLCRVLHANPSGVNFTWQAGNKTLEDDIDEGASPWESSLLLPAESRGASYTCLVENAAGESQPCSRKVTAYLGLAGTVPESADKKMFIIASVIGGIAILFVFIIIVMIIFMRRKRLQEAAKKGQDPLYQNLEGNKENGGTHPEDGESRAMYENMPFHSRKTGPYRPDTDDVLYADVYDDVKAGKIPDPRAKPPLPPKGIGKKPKEPPLPPKTKKKGEAEEMLGMAPHSASK